MREVSCRATRMVLEVLEEAGVGVDALVDGLPLSLEQLRDPHARIDWNLYSELLERIERVCGEDLPPEEIGRRLVGVPSFEFLRRAGQLVVSPKQIYDIGFRLLTPALFANVSVRCEWLASGRLVIHGELSEGSRPSRAFFRICAGNIAAVPGLLDLPSAAIEEHVLSGTRSRLVLVPPPSHTLGTRLLRRARSLRGFGDAWRGVARQQREIEQSLEVLRTSRHELQQLIERLPDGVLIQRDGVIRWANAVLLEILGVSALDAVVGRPIVDFVPSEDRASMLAAVRRAAANEVSAESLEYRVLRADGTLRRVQSASAQVVTFEGEPARLVVLRDVTEQHRLREQAAISERLASIGALAASVAHEINNPLAYVRLSLRAASREAQSLDGQMRAAELHASLARASEGTARVLAIVRDLKMLSRANEDAFEPVDVAKVLDAALSLAGNAIAFKARLERQYDQVPSARASSSKLGQVFLNLLTNAADAIPEGAPTENLIRVTLRTDAGGRVVIEISDTGCGIPAATGARVFDPFFTTKPPGAGTGLGLAICHRIVAELGGEISFESRPGATSFRVALPPASAVAKTDGPHVAPARERTRKRILVVDDEPPLLASLSFLLTKTHDVVTATGGHVALAILQEDRAFDVVLTDLMMADLSGMDVYETVRAQFPGFERRFLFMTGGAFTARAQSFVESTTTRCIEKPFDVAELIEAIETIALA